MPLAPCGRGLALVLLLLPAAQDGVMRTAVDRGPCAVGTPGGREVARTHYGGRQATCARARVRGAARSSAPCVRRATGLSCSRR
jgi:hypothetical protein